MAGILKTLNAMSQQLLERSPHNFWHGDAYCPNELYYANARTLHSLFYPIKPPKILKQNWLQFLFVVKAAAVYKYQISKFCPQMQSTEASFHIHNIPLTHTNVTVC